MIAENNLSKPKDYFLYSKKKLLNTLTMYNFYFGIEKNDIIKEKFNINKIADGFERLTVSSINNDNYKIFINNIILRDINNKNFIIEITTIINFYCEGNTLLSLNDNVNFKNLFKLLEYKSETRIINDLLSLLYFSGYQIPVFLQKSIFKIDREIQYLILLIKNGKPFKEFIDTLNIKYRDCLTKNDYKYLFKINNDLLIESFKDLILAIYIHKYDVNLFFIDIYNDKKHRFSSITYYFYIKYIKEIIPFFSKYSMFSEEKVREFMDYLAYYENTYNSKYDRNRFNFKGRTIESVFKISDEWHFYQKLREREVNNLNRRNTNRRYNNYNQDFIDKDWNYNIIDYTTNDFKIIQLKNYTQLCKEGYEMHNCVSSYSKSCIVGNTAICSYRNFKNNNSATIEIRMPIGHVVQVRGPRNKRLTINKDISIWLNKNNFSISNTAF
jgi:hypothetical protein